MAIEAGLYTYGHQGITTVINQPDTHVKLGKFCSVATGVKVLLGGNHKMDWITTFPFGHTSTDVFNVGKIDGHSYGNGDIIIGNDVWLARDCSIMSGVKIGDGAVVAAYAHVVSDVEPYTIVGGNPAKTIKLRFEQRIVDALLELKWWDLDVEEIKNIIPMLCSEPDYDILQELIQKYRK